MKEIAKSEKTKHEEIQQLHRRIASLENVIHELENRLSESERERARISEDLQHKLADLIRFESICKKNLDRYRTLVENIPGAVYRCANDAAWTMEIISHQIEEMSGYPALDFINNEVRTFGSIIAHEDVIKVINAVNDGVNAHKPYVIQYRLIHKDGSIRWVYEKGQGVFAEDGTLLWLDGVIFDITDRIQFFDYSEQK
jgi:PAS domain S-box-containing protein